MLKKLLVLLTLMSMILTVSVPVIYGFDAEKTTLNIDGGVLVFEGTHTAADDVNVELNFKSYVKSSNADKYDPFMKIIGDKVIRFAKGGTSSTYERTICTLTKGETYYFTIVYKHSDVSGTESSYDVYINGVKAGTANDYNHSYLRRLADFRGTNKGAFTLAFSSDETSATYDMAPYSALISSANENIVLANSTAFEGFTATLLANMAVGELVNNVTASAGATVSVVRGETALAEGELIATDDVIVVRSQNAKVVNKYAVTVDAPVIIEPAVTSTRYTVDDFTVKGVYEYTPVNTFMSYIAADEGWTVTLKNGDTEVTSGVVSESMTLVATDGESVQTYAIEYANRVSVNNETSNKTVNLPCVIPYKDNFTGSLVVEMSAKVADKYFTGGKFGSNNNNALWVEVKEDDSVNLIMNTNAWATVDDKFRYSTDLEVGDDINLTFVVRPDYEAATEEYKTKIDYYVNDNYVSTCALATIKAADWENWRVPMNTVASIYMVEDLDAYMAAKNADKIKFEDGKVSAYFAGKSSDKLYLAVYSGNELETIKVADFSDFNFKADVLSVPANAEGKTVKVFLWSSDLTPIDFMKISEQTDILFDREFDS